MLNIITTHIYPYIFHNVMNNSVKLGSWKHAEFKNVNRKPPCTCRRKEVALRTGNRNRNRDFWTLLIGSLAEANHKFLKKRTFSPWGQNYYCVKCSLAIWLKSRCGTERTWSNFFTLAQASKYFDLQKPAVEKERENVVEICDVMLNGSWHFGAKFKNSISNLFFFFH